METRIAKKNEEQSSQKQNNFPIFFSFRTFSFFTLRWIVCLTLQLFFFHTTLDRMPHIATPVAAEHVFAETTQC